MSSFSVVDAPSRREAIGAVPLLIGVLLLLLAASPVAAQRPPVQVSVYPSTRAVTVGERFTLSVVVEHNFQAEILFPTTSALARRGVLEFLSQQEVQSRYRGADRPGGRVDSAVYTVAAFGADSVRIPALPVQVVIGGDTLPAPTPPQTLRIVSTVGPNAQALRDIAPVAPFPQPLWPWILLGLVVASVIGGLGYWWWSRRSVEEEAASASVVDTVRRSPYQHALNTLERLDRYDVADPQEGRAYYVELSDLVRRYVQQRLDIDASHQTTAEIVVDLEAHPRLPPEPVLALQSVLEQADRVKFADAHPDPVAAQQARRDVQNGLQAIEQTVAAASSDRERASVSS